MNFSIGKSNKLVVRDVMKIASLIFYKKINRKKILRIM